MLSASDWERNDPELTETQVPGSSAYFVRPNMVPVATRIIVGKDRVGFLKLRSSETTTDILYINIYILNYIY